MKAVALLLASIALCGDVRGQTIRMNDSSDWWSMYSEKEPGLPVELVHKNFDVKNFRVLGFSLTTLDFAQVAATLGKARIVDRGDASYSRSQVCYLSGQGSEPVHLIFEGGEGGSSSLYLFRGGPDWKGSNLCFKSDRVSPNLSTETGLRLGLSRVQVEAILGKSDAASGGRIAYCREFQRKATRKEFESSVKAYPGHLTDEEAHRQFDFVPVTIQIEARFNNLGLSYLYVSTITD
jgi:hypothetical protein